MEEIHIRPERRQDYPAVSRLVEAAFAGEEHSDHREHLLVERLRGSAAYIPYLALVALEGDAVTGYIMLTRLTIGGSHASLALAPVAVDPPFHGRGIGSSLITEALRRAAGAGFRSAVVLGHKDYYPRFGFRLLAQWGITMPFDAPEECCMAVELMPGALDGVSGVVEYPAEFFE